MSPTSCRAFPVSAVLGFAAGLVAAVGAGLAFERDPVARLPKLGAQAEFPVSLAVPTLLPQQRPESELRAFVVGASETYGFPYEPPGQASFATLLEKGLRAVTGRNDIHVRPEANPALDSEQIVAQAKRLLSWNPSLLIVVIGGNEYLNRIAHGRALVADDLPGRIGDLASSWRWAIEALGEAVTGWGFLRERLGGSGTGDVRGFAAFVRRSEPGRPALRGLPVGPADRRLLAVRMRDRLIELAAACRRKGCRLVIALAPHRCDPTPPWCSELTPLPAPLEQEVARAVLAPQGLPLSRLTDLERRLGPRADLSYARARRLRFERRPRAAARAFARALDLDLAPLHRTSEVVAMLEEAARRAGVRYLNLDEPLRAADGITGPERFLDYAHPDLEGHLALAWFVARRLGGDELPEVSASDRPAFLAAARAHLARTVVPESRELARARLYFTVGRYYLAFGNFRDAREVLAIAAQRLPEARPDYEFCVRKLEAARSRRP